MSRPVDGLVRPPSSYEEYLLLSEKDKLRLMRQSKKIKRPNAEAHGRRSRTVQPLVGSLDGDK